MKYLMRIKKNKTGEFPEERIGIVTISPEFKESIKKRFEDYGWLVISLETI